MTRDKKKKIFPCRKSFLFQAYYIYATLMREYISYKLKCQINITIKLIQ